MRLLRNAIPLIALLAVALLYLATGTATADEPPAGAAVAVAPAAPSLDDQRARKIIDEVDDLYRGASSEGVFAMTVQTKHWARTMEMRAWALGKDYTLIRILEPKKERGTATLKAGSDIFNYLSKTDRTIKITSGMMSGSWMGSHFTNDDLVKESRMADDYYIAIGFDGERDGEKVWDFTLTPKPDAPVVWGKVVLTVEQESRLPLEQRYYDEDGGLARTMTFGDVKTMDGRTIPTSMTMRPTDKPDEYTKIVYKEIDFDVKLDESFFTLQNLKSR